MRAVIALPAGSRSTAARRASRLRPALFVCIVIFTGAACAGKKPAMDSPIAPTGNSEPSQGKTMRLRAYRCVDENGIGGEVFRMLVPADWKAESRIVWRLNVPSAPAAVSFRVWNPDGDEAFEGFPVIPLFWTDNPDLLRLFPQGSSYFGMEVREPCSIEDALLKIVFPRFRKGAANVRVLTRKPMPEVVEALGLQERSPGGGVRFAATAAKVRVEYTLAGKEYTEDLLGVRESLRIPVQGMLAMTTNENWTLSYLVGMRASRGQLDSRSGLFMTMASSIRLNREWFNRYVQLVEMLIQAQIRNIRLTGDFSRLLAQTSAEISEERMSAYESRQRAYDRMSENFSDYVRGVDRYTDADGNIVKLPSGYRNAWTNGLGEYIVSESEDYNPNIGSNQNWQPLKKD